MVHDASLDLAPFFRHASFCTHPRLINYANDMNNDTRRQPNAARRRLTIEYSTAMASLQLLPEVLPEVFLLCARSRIVFSPRQKKKKPGFDGSIF
jgi:hypothetical protein